MKTDKLWAASLIVIGAVTLVYTVTSLAGFELPDALKRILGVLDLIALPVLVFTTVRKANRK